MIRRGALSQLDIEEDMFQEGEVYIRNQSAHPHLTSREEPATSVEENFKLLATNCT